MPTLTSAEMTVWTRYIHEITGISLDQSKGYLIETRLAPLLKETSSANFSELIAKVRSDAENRLRRRVIDAITTNETSFFRDSSPFELLRHKLLPEFIDRRGKAGRLTLRIWSAACSTGQEAYSTAMVLRDLLGDLSKHDIRILGTDISNKAVAQASAGLYTPHEIERGLPEDALSRHFTRQGEQWKVRDELRGIATFRTMNLLEPFGFPLPFDIIFCRNVAIYFSDTDRKRLFSNLGKCLAPDGALIIGSTESLTGLCPEFESQRHLRSVFYRFKTPAARS